MLLLSRVQKGGSGVLFGLAESRSSCSNRARPSPARDSLPITKPPQLTPPSSTRSARCVGVPIASVEMGHFWFPFDCCWVRVCVHKPTNHMFLFCLCIDGFHLKSFMLACCRRGAPAVQHARGVSGMLFSLSESRSSFRVTEPDPSQPVSIYSLLNHPS